nr:J domain-containing protein [Acidobacteriota bacterium]
FRGGEDFRPPQGWGGVDFNFGGGGGDFSGGVPSGFSDFFDTFFGRAGRAGQPQGGRGQARPVYEGRSPFAQDYEFDRAPREGKTHEVEITVSLEDAYNGTTKAISLESEVRAPDGSRRKDTKTYQVKIPPGTTDGTKIRLAGQGSKSIGGGASGDLLLKVQLAPHARFTVDGHDLKAAVSIAPWEAALGAKIEVPTVEGKAQLRIPPGTQSGQKFRLRERGVPSLRNPQARGDQFIEVQVTLPKVISEETKDLLKRYAQMNPENPRVAMGLE